MIGFLCQNEALMWRARRREPFFLQGHL